MGEIANDIIEGRQCSWCGICFKRSHGFPVVCRSCGKDEDYDEDKHPPVATEEEY